MARMVVKSKLDSREYEAGVERIKQKTSTFGNTVKSVGVKLKAAFAASVIVAAIKRVTDSVVGLSAELWNMSKQASVSTGSLQKLANIPRRFGEDTDTVRDALGALRTAQGEVLRGDEGMLKEFQELGITLDEVAGMDVDQLFVRIGKALKETGNDAARFSAVAKIIGEGDALKLQEVFESAADGLDRLGNEFGDLSEKQIAQIEVSRRWFDEQKKGIQGFWAGSGGR